jgi:cellulose synthase/poly-beta-1,6-N-acetylglucosamine synthase-like glycosyltransferase
MQISVLIPAHNEERSIKKTVQSCLDQTRPFDEIVVVNDGSTDCTLEILNSFGDKIKVVNIAKATGNKSYAQQYGLDHITGDIFVATDGDTILDKDFAKYIEPHFEDEKTVAVAGYVTSIKNNWLTACREIDYTFGQNIHKKAQSHINFIFVIPGCAGAFRRKVFMEKISFDHDTLTEDLDFTYKLHRMYMNIKFEPKAKVYTQDPFTIRAYINQMRRWYSGGWQNFLKHGMSIISRPVVALELSLTYLEGLIFSVLLFILPFINFFVFLKFMLFYFVFMLCVGVYVAIKNKRKDLIIFSAFYFLIIFVNAWVFIEQFFLEIVLGRKKVVWFKPERKII